MKQPHLLILLLLLATGAGLFLYRGTPDSLAPDSSATQSGEKKTIASFLEKETGLTFKKTAETKTVSDLQLFEAVKDSLVRRYGPEGLKHRNRVFELLGLLPPGHRLERELRIAETAAKPGWFDSTTGIIYLHERFQGFSAAEQATFVYLNARALLQQHDPLPATPLSDDARNMREAIHGGIASILEGKFRASKSTDNALPSSPEMEREAALLSLPIYLHNLIQLPSMQGKDYVKKQLTAGKTIRSILDNAPTSTLALFSEQAPNEQPTPPEFTNLVLKGSLGAYTTQLIGERLSDYVTAELLAETWRGDWYFYSSDERGENLCWISQWDSPDAAKKLEALLQRHLIPSTEEDFALTNPLIKRADGSLVLIYYSDQKSLKEIILQFGQTN